MSCTVFLEYKKDGGKYLSDYRNDGDFLIWWGFVIHLEKKDIVFEN